MRQSISIIFSWVWGWAQGSTQTYWGLLSAGNSTSDYVILTSDSGKRVNANTIITLKGLWFRFMYYQWHHWVVAQIQGVHYLLGSSHHSIFWSGNSRHCELRLTLLFHISTVWSIWYLIIIKRNPKLCSPNPGHNWRRQHFKQTQHQISSFLK